MTTPTRLITGALTGIGRATALAFARAAPEEIAQTIVFLASDKARLPTGQSIAVDGCFPGQ